MFVVQTKGLSPLSRVPKWTCTKLEFSLYSMDAWKMVVLKYFEILVDLLMMYIQMKTWFIGWQVVSRAARHHPVTPRPTARRSTTWRKRGSRHFLPIMLRSIHNPFCTLFHERGLCLNLAPQVLVIVVYHKLCCPHLRYDFHWEPHLSCALAHWEPWRDDVFVQL